jgi:HK97 family phage portal protein
MGLITDAFRALRPTSKAAIAASIPIWDSGREQSPAWSYERGAREGYTASDLVYACINLRAVAAGEPPLCAYRGDEKIEEHPALDLLNRPNPFQGRSQFWGSLAMHLDIGGNAYVEKVRSASGKLVELWLLRPDRVKVIPDARRFIGGYAYTIGSETTFLPPENVIHFKTRHPLDDYYGLPPLAAVAGRVDIDVWMRSSYASFFRNAGVVSGLLNVKRAMSAGEKEDARRIFRETYGGPDGWHKLLLIDAEQATYTPMGMPPGASGLAMPDMNLINESRILAAFGVPASMLPTMLGGQSNRGQSADESERDKFWELTMVPLFRDLDTTLWMGLEPEFPEVKRIEHDLSTVDALQEDEDKMHTRIRENWKGGLLTWKEARAKLGEDEEPEEPGIVLVASNTVPTWSDEMLEEPEEPEPMEMPPAPGAAPGQNGTAPQPPPMNGRANGTAAPARPS